MKTNYESNIWKFYLFMFLNGLELTIPIYVLFLLANNLSMTQVMILEVIFIVLTLGLEVPSGAFADLYGRKTAFIISDLSFVIGFLIFGFGTNFWHFLIANILVACSMAFWSGTDSAFVYDTLKELKREKDYAKIFGRGHSFVNIIFAFMALAGVAIASKTGYRPLFFITAGFVFLAIFVALSFKEPPIHKKLLDRKYSEHLKEALKFASTHKIVRNFIIYFSVAGALSHLTWFVLQPYYGQSSLPIYFVGIAIFLYFFIYSFGMMFSNFFVKKFSEKGVIFTNLLISSFSFIGFFFINKIAALVVLSIMTFFNGVSNIFVDRGINHHTDSHHRATVLSIKNMGKSIFYAIFAPLIGLFTDIFSPEAAFLMMGVGLFAHFIFIVFLFSYKKRKT